MENEPDQEAPPKPVPKGQIEQDDPCIRAAQLRLAKDKIITGLSVSEYDFETGNGVRRRVKYNAANLTRLEDEIRKAEAACAALTGKRPRRFAIGPIRGRR